MIPSGGCCINDTITHIATNYLPFGGIGESGMGSYHERLDSIHLRTIRAY